MKNKLFFKIVALLCVFCLLCVPVQGAGSRESHRNAPDGMPGDIDGNGQVNNLDVEMLLWHTLFPGDYPLTVSGDFEKDGIVDNKDVEYLLWHTLFPEEYPLVSHQHSYTQAVTAPTCTEKGFTTYTCTLCGDCYTADEVAAKGHSWQHISTINGIKTENCSGCGKSQTTMVGSHVHNSNTLVTMTVAEAAPVCDALGNYSLLKYSHLTDVSIDICTQCAYVDFTSVKSIYTPQEETEIFIALAKPVRDAFLYQNALDAEFTEEEALEHVETYKHVSDTICINHAVRRAEELTVDFSHNGSPDNCAENIRYGVQNIEGDFLAWCNSIGHYHNIISWAYPYVGYGRYIIGDPTFETIRIYSVTIFGYYDR